MLFEALAALPVTAVAVYPVPAKLFLSMLLVAGAFGIVNFPSVSAATVTASRSCRRTILQLAAPKLPFFYHMRFGRDETR